MISSPAAFIAPATVFLAAFTALSSLTAGEYAAAGLKNSSVIYCRALSAAAGSVGVVALLSRYIIIDAPFIKKSGCPRIIVYVQHCPNGLVAIMPMYILPHNMSTFNWRFYIFG